MFCIVVSLLYVFLVDSVSIFFMLEILSWVLVYSGLVGLFSRLLMMVNNCFWLLMGSG